MKIQKGCLKKFRWLTRGTQDLGAPARCQGSQELPPKGLQRKNWVQRVTSTEEQTTTQNVKGVSNLTILFGPERSLLARISLVLLSHASAYSCALRQMKADVTPLSKNMNSCMYITNGCQSPFTNDLH